MRLIEKDAKELLHTLGIKTPTGFFIPWEISVWPANQAWFGPCYLKSQVLAGRRGKGGLVRRCETIEIFNQYIKELHAALSPDICDGFWCEAEAVHTEEWFVACDIDQATGTLRAHVSAEGGKEVAEVKTVTLAELASGSVAGIPAPILSFMETLILALPGLDAISIEINPCVINADQEVVALDAKIELDEAASFRHPEWKALSPLSRFGAVSSVRERAYLDLLLQSDRPLLGTYVELSGNIGVILAGGGASLVAMDALRQAQGKAANYLELSGNPDPDFLRQAAKVVFSHPDIRAVWIAGSFANFTDIRATVSAILMAIEESGLRVPVLIRRDGPEADAAEREAYEWAKRYGVNLIFQRGDIDLSQSAAAVVALAAL